MFTFTRPRFVRMPCGLAVVAVLTATKCIGATPAEPGEAKVLKVVQDFEATALGGRRPAALYWNWTPEQKASALEYSSIEIVGDAAVGERCLKLVVTGRLPPSRSGYRMIPLDVDYLPPETDAVRLRVKVLKGRFTFAAGGPTVYFGHSDVMTRSIQLSADTHAQWTTVELSLNENLTRNDRRAQWARHSPVVYYTRWIQEPLAINVAAGSEGEMLIDQVELIARGQGQPYPVFEPRQIRTIAPGIDFEADATMANAFTVLSSTTEQPEFDQAPHLVRKAWPPPRIARVAEGRGGRYSLEMVMTGAEECCFAGVRLAGAGEANAIALTVKAQYAGRGKPDLVLDFLAWAARPDQHGEFPWDDLRPPASWRNSPEIAYTYYLSPKNAAAARASFGFYHIRRTVPNDQWVTLVLPLADFICSYGQGAMAPAFQQQSPLAGDQVLALTFLSYFGQAAHPLRMLIDDVTFVKVPGTPRALRSFHQSPGP